MQVRVRKERISFSASFNPNFLTPHLFNFAHTQTQLLSSLESAVSGFKKKDGEILTDAYVLDSPNHLMYIKGIWEIWSVNESQ